MENYFEAFCIFKGIGNPDSKIWFVGLEEGGLPTSKNDLRKELKKLKIFPFYINPRNVRKIKTPVWDYISKFLIEFYYMGDQIDWKMCRERMLSSYSFDNNDIDNISTVGVVFPKVFLTELFPLSKKKFNKGIKENNKLFGFSSNREYINHVREYRFPLLFSFWEEKHPDLTLCYGKSGWQHYIELFHLNNEIPEKYDDSLFYKTKNILLVPFLGNGRISNNKINNLSTFVKNVMINALKPDIIYYVASFKPIMNYFSCEFIESIIKDYKITGHSQFHNDNHILANMIMGHRMSYYEKNNFLTELSKMLIFFSNNLPNVLNLKDTHSRLTCNNEANFQGKWTELSFAFYLWKKGEKILEMNPINEKGVEITDIRTDKGAYELTTLLSKQLNEEIFSLIPDSSKFSNEIKFLVDRKLRDKENQNSSNFIVIDATRSSEIMSQKVINDYITELNWDVFHRVAKGVILIFRDPNTEQIYCEQIINNK